MELRCYCDYNWGKVILMGTLLFCISCAGAKEANLPSENMTQLLHEEPVSEQDTVARSTNTDLKLNYENESTNVTIPIDPQNQEFILELKGVHQKGYEEDRSKDSSVKQDSIVQEKMAKQIKKVLKDFRRAQDLFYREDYKGAMEKVNSSLEIQETADALGLKGTIFFMRNNMSSAKYYWNRAVQMDPEIPVPNIPELESLIKDIKSNEDSEEVEE